MRLDDDVGTQEVGMSKDQLCWVNLFEINLTEASLLTPSDPRPFVLPSSLINRSNSHWRAAFLDFSALVEAGRAKIHFCMTVQIFGLTEQGEISTIACRIARSASDGSCAESCIMRPCRVFPLTTPSSMLVTGKTPCHSPRRRATPRQTLSLLRSGGEHTRPRINRYIRPLSKRARSGGARL
jgi:hypothetical protein